MVLLLEISHKLIAKSVLLLQQNGATEVVP